MNKEIRISIVGTGISGLNAAYQILQYCEKYNLIDRVKITIFEKNQFPGGRIQSYNPDGEKYLATDIGGEFIVGNNKKTLNLLNDLEIETIKRDENRVILLKQNRNDKFKILQVPISDNIILTLFKGLKLLRHFGFMNLFRIFSNLSTYESVFNQMYEILEKTNNNKQLEELFCKYMDQTCYDYLNNEINLSSHGTEILNTVFQPLYMQNFGTMSSIVIPSGIGAYRNDLFTVKGSNFTIIQTLIEKLELYDDVVQIKYNTPIEKISNSDHSYILNNTFVCDFLFLATPISVSKEIEFGNITGSSLEYIDLAKQIKYHSSYKIIIRGKMKPKFRKIEQIKSIHTNFVNIYMINKFNTKNGKIRDDNYFIVSSLTSATTTSFEKELVILFDNYEIVKEFYHKNAYPFYSPENIRLILEMEKVGEISNKEKYILFTDGLFTSIETSLIKSSKFVKSVIDHLKSFSKEKQINQKLQT